jgi:hypothetical protein
VKGAVLAVGLSALGMSLDARAQSTHLLALESAAPATTPDLVTGVVSPGWAGLWANPSAEPRLLGIGLGLERNGFGAVRTLLAQAAFRLGPRWSVAIGQTSVGDLFDPELLQQDPSLSGLEATAFSASLNAAGRLVSVVTGSAGVRVERDQLLGLGETGWMARVGIASRLAPSLRLGATYEWTLGTDIGPVGPGIVRLGVGREWAGGPWRGTFAVAGELGGLWRYTRSYRAVAATGSVSLSALTLGASLAGQRDLYSRRSWRTRPSAFVGVALPPFSLQLRVATEPGEAGTVLATAVAVELGR